MERSQGLDRSVADFTDSFFVTFMVLQMLAVFLLTPAYVAGAVAEEREQQTLDSLLATDLRDREIVLGKLLARLAALSLVVLTGLPILGFLQFLGGVDPNLVLAGFALTGLSMASLAGLAMLQSVYARRPRQAILRTYLLGLAYLLLSGASWLLLIPWLRLANFPSTEAWQSPMELRDVVDWFNIGNPLAAVVQLLAHIHAGRKLDDLLTALLRDYAWFHGLLALVCCIWAVRVFRRQALRPEDDSRAVHAQERSSLLGWLLLGARPRVWQRCVLWKEAFAESETRSSPVRKLLAGVLVALVFWPVIHVMFVYGRILPNGPNDDFSFVLNYWVRAASALLGVCLLLSVAIRAAGSISSERERQTLDGLLATPLSNRAILFGKWLGSIAGPRGLALWLLPVWGLGLLTAALHPLAIPCFVGAWLVLAALASGVGLWFSIAAHKTRRATVFTLLALGLAEVYQLLCWDFPIHSLPQEANTWRILGYASTIRLLYSIPALPDVMRSRLTLDQLGGVLIVFMIRAGMVLALWILCGIRFRVVTGREGQIKQRIPAPEHAAPEHAAQASVL
jgi:ABC-type transport system involved in multi-copper enzyme maturation permease subunit